jgi:hypothetical protein
MPTSETKIWKRIENSIPFLVGLGEVLLGLAFVAIDKFISVSTSIMGVISEVGIGLIAAGIITLTLEPITRRRLQSDIEEVKRTHFETLLTGVMPEPIFKEVQAHIIRQPFLRENVQTTFELSWVDEKRTSVFKYSVAQYDVTNISKTNEIYQIRVIEEKEIGSKFPDFTKISEIRIQLDEQKEDVYDFERLKDHLRITDELIEVRMGFPLAPDQKARVTVKSQSILSDRIHIYVMTVPTVNLELTVVHREDMILRAIPLHPSESNFRQEIDTPSLNRWRITGGLLSFQGFEVTWFPKEIEHTLETA